MFEAAAIDRIKKVQNNWQYRKLFSLMLMLFSVMICLIVLLHLMIGLSYWWLFLLWTLGFGAIYFTTSLWQFSEKLIAHHLNQNYPILEESIDLLLVPVEERTVLENLQAEKVSQLFLALEPTAPFEKLLQRSIWFLVGSILIGASMLFFSSSCSGIKNTVRLQSGKTNEIILPEIKHVFVQINPPAYTGKKSRIQQAFSILAEEASSIEWRLETNLPLDSMVLILNDSAHYRFKSIDKQHTQWQLQLPASVNGIYQIKLPNKISDHYALELIRDQIPVIQIQSPKQYTVIDYGEPKQLSLIADVKDDYGIVSANLVATVASGGGEAVKFKEHQFPLMSAGASFQQIQFKKRIDLNTYATG